MLIDMPVQHAWLVDTSGRVVDPTYGSTIDHVYFLIVFGRDFVIDMLAKNNGQAGLLGNLHLLRRQFRDPTLLEDVIRNGMIDLKAYALQTMDTEGAFQHSKSNA